MIRSGWQVWSAVCLQRLPVVSRTLTPLEQRWSAMLAQVELERSFLSLHEMRHLADLERQRLALKEGVDFKAADGALATAVETEDVWREEAAKFKPIIVDSGESCFLRLSFKVQGSFV